MSAWKSWLPEAWYAFAGVIPWYMNGLVVAVLMVYPAGQVTRQLTVGYMVSLVPTTMGLPLFTTTFDTLMPVAAAWAGCAVNAPRASGPESAATRADLPVRMHVVFMRGSPSIGTRIAAG